jgi:hypothetical protein
MSSSPFVLLVCAFVRKNCLVYLAVFFLYENADIKKTVSGGDFIEPK